MAARSQARRSPGSWPRSRERFPGGGADPIEVVAMTPPDDPELAAWAATVAGRDDVAAVDVDDTLAQVGTAQIDVVPDGPTQGDVAQALGRRPPPARSPIRHAGRR